MEIDSNEKKYGTLLKIRREYLLLDQIINNGEVWSGYHKKYSPPTNNQKNLILKIVDDCKNIEIIGNNLDNFFPIKLNIEDIYLVYKLR